MRKRNLPSFDEDLSEEPLINLTPLIDVVFVVLISFMLIAPILSTDSVLLAQGSAAHSGPDVSQKEKLLISIQADNQIRWKGKQVCLDELKTILLAIRKNHPQTIPQLIPDARSHFETYQQVKNLLEECGFEQMEILLRPS